MRVVVDTNTLVSGLLWHGTPARLLDAVLDNRVELCLTVELLGELDDVLRRPKLARQVAERGLDVDWFCSFLRERCLMLNPPELLGFPGLRDANDLPVLACAITAAADAIVTGDQDLLTLVSVQGIPIMDAATGLIRLNLA